MIPPTWRAEATDPKPRAPAPPERYCAGEVDFAAIGQILLTTFLLYAISAACGYIQGWIMANISMDISYRFRRDIAEIRRNARYLSDMVSDILDLARIEEGRFSLQREPFDVVVTLRGTIDRLTHLAQERGITLALQVPDGLSFVMASAPRSRFVETEPRMMEKLCGAGL